MADFTPILSIPETYLEAVKERLARHTKLADNGCLEWTGSLDRGGYARFKLRHGELCRYTGAHRAAWLAHKGPIKDPELVIDHLCRTRHCVNVEHMELVTSRENTRRGDLTRIGRPRLGPGEKHACGKHGRAQGREKLRKDGYRFWVCFICRRAYNRAYYARVKSKGIESDVIQN